MLQDGMRVRPNGGRRRQPSSRVPPVELKHTLLLTYDSPIRGAALLAEAKRFIR